MNPKDNKSSQYKSILNNLLDVNPSDKAIFTKVNDKFSFDFYNLFGPESFDFIYSHKNFDIPILELNLIRICHLLEQCSTYDEVMEILKNNNFEISNNQSNQLKKQFNDAKSKIIHQIKANFQKQALKWKLFLNKANEINAETNIWPIHLGFLFVKVLIDGKSVYAPLFFKEVYLEIRNARPFLISNGDIKPNEKLMFLLNNAGFDLDLDENYGEWSIKELLKYLHEQWGEIYELNVNINTEFTNLEADDIKNESLEFVGGVVLGLFQPSGGYVRNRMLEIINNNDINNIIQVEFNKNIYKNRVSETLFNPKTSIFKITPTNLSQDKAIASSLNQNTIIWGPPGTGKSQTIVNILTNLLVYGKNSLVCSQKKAALEVIRNRMGELKPFCLFMLNSKNMNKKSFYTPIKKYLDYLENYDEQDNLKPLRVISHQELNFVNNIEKFIADERFLEASKIISKIQPIWENFNSDFWNKIVSLPKDIKYPDVFNFSNSADLKKYMLKINNMRYKFYKPLNWKIKKHADNLFNDFRYFQGNLNEILAQIKSFKSDDYKYIHDLISILPKYENNDVSDEFELKKFIAKNIIKKINNFTVDEKSEYTEFAATVRLSSIEPYKFMKRFASMIKKIFPIIIVTPEADLSAWNKEEFDYAILDESSQIFIEKGLPVLYLAKIKILAGDDQQMKPSNWFGVRAVDDDSIYSKVDSLLDFAKSLGMYNVLLDKNYRSNYAALMTFSSKYFYNSTLDIIDSASTEKDFSPIEVINANGVWENNQNLAEIDTVIKLAKENLHKYNKIILLCFNAKQQDSITTKIFKSESELENAINNNILLLRNIENIQGDEADLVIASVAYDAKTSIHSTYVGRTGGKNALNVAISRAKDKMIVVKSLYAKDLTILTDNEDAITFKRWLEFLELNNKEKLDFLNKSQTKENDEISESTKSSLTEEFENTINETIKDKKFLQLTKNESIGTIKVDYILKRNDIPVLCFIIDDYTYANNANEYIMQKDLVKFIKSKKYNLYSLDRIKWESQKNEIIDLINTYEDLEKTSKNIYITKTISMLTTQLEIMDNSNDKIIVEKDYKTEEISVLEYNINKEENIIKNQKNEQPLVNEETKLQNHYLEKLREDTESIVILNSEEHKDDTLAIIKPKPKALVSEKILYKSKNEDNYVEREETKIISFDENTKQWEQILSQEININTSSINAIE
ncbi:AAA domain-containing protein [Mycoplasmopsis primatum]|uniref:AAA domain-containing protein n=1 Tax=Mycoplasmopsis primatum TaxID=55604 RepID=UPI0004957839|nr:AAA domain-containing protein [Mycoplasmopsis primatum]